VFDHVLLATDFSSASERALEAAAVLARDLRARLTVLHVYPVFSTSPEIAERTWPGGIRSRARLDRVVDDLRGRGLHVEGALRFGHPPGEIVEVAIERGADLIVTGTHGRTGLARIWYGSVAEQVARRSPIPVLALPISTGTSGAVLRRQRVGHDDAIRDNVIHLRLR
jgi:nucleotide-binding universal stress UspA family protein